jgi:hypothetical protein
MYPELFPTSPANLPWTIPSIALCTVAEVKAVVFAVVATSISSSSLSSEITGTVGRERPAEMGACVSGVFWGVGAVMFEVEMGNVDDMAGTERKEKVGFEDEYRRSFGLSRLGVVAHVRTTFLGEAGFNRSPVLLGHPLAQPPAPSTVSPRLYQQ